MKTIWKKTAAAAALCLAVMSAGCGGSTPATEAPKTEAPKTEAAKTEEAKTEETKAEETKTEEKSTEAVSAEQKEKKPLREMNVVLDWYPNAIHSFLYAAIERGYFE
jgi:putative hydroxymethylpyrimidine transport system substrate-binding protein